jgi:hypothetical protein
MEGALKARRGGGTKKGPTMDGGWRNRCRGDRQSCRKIKQQAKNYREIKAKQGKTNTNNENNRRDARARTGRKSLKEVAVEA